MGCSVPPDRVRDSRLASDAVELVLTLGLVSVILGTASQAQNVGAISALGVGGYIALAGLWSAPISGASMNPARSFGPALIVGDFTTSGSTSSARSPGAGSPSARPGSYAEPAATRSRRAAGSGVLTPRKP